MALVERWQVLCKGPGVQNKGSPVTFLDPSLPPGREDLLPHLVSSALT